MTVQLSFVSPLPLGDQLTSSRSAVVVIDPDPQRRDALTGALARLYRVSEFPGIEAAIGRTMSSPAAIIVSDQVPLSKGVEPVRLLRHHPPFEFVPIILSSDSASLDPLRMTPPPDAVIKGRTAADEAPEVLSGLLNKVVEAGWSQLPRGPREALERSLAAFSAVVDLVGANGLVEYKTVTDACGPIVEVVQESSYGYIFEGLRYHDNLVYVHSLRVATVLTMFGKAIGLGEDQLMILASGGLMHDIGKLALPPKLLNKPSALSGAEWTLMHDHVGSAVRSLDGHSDIPRGVAAIIAQHHERLDGSGYPDKLSGDQLNDLVRMAAIVDVFAALTERRPYRPALSPGQALDVIREKMAAQLDLRLVGLFGAMLVEATS